MQSSRPGRRFATNALMFGNIVTGTTVLAPAGMWGELSSGLDVRIRDAGLLITFGAIVLCVGSPLTTWLTSGIERPALLQHWRRSRTSPRPARPIIGGSDLCRQVVGRQNPKAGVNRRSAPASR